MPEREFLAASLDRERRERRTHRRRLAIAFGALVLGLVAIGRRRASWRSTSAATPSTSATSPSRASWRCSRRTRSTRIRSSRLALALWAEDTSRPTRPAPRCAQATLGFRELAVLPADSLDAQHRGLQPGRRPRRDGGDRRDRAHVGRRDAARGRRAWRPATARCSPRAMPPATSDRARVRGRDARGDRRVARQPRTSFQARGQRSTASPSAATASASPRRWTTARCGSSPRTGAAARRLGGHDGRCSASTSTTTGAASSAPARTAGSGSGNAERTQILHRGKGAQTDVEFSPDGRRILGVGYDGRIRFWDAGTGARSGDASGGGRELTAAAFSADGRRFATGGQDGVIRVWSAAGGPPVAVLRGQRSRMYDVGFGAAGDRVVSAGDDGTARIWDAGRTQAWTGAGRDLQHRLQPPTAGSSPAASEDGTVRVWDAGDRAVCGRACRASGRHASGRYSPDRRTRCRHLRATASPCARVAVSRPTRRNVVAERPKGAEMNAARVRRDRQADRLRGRREGASRCATCVRPRGRARRRRR